MDPATLNILMLIGTAVGGYFLRYLQAKNNPNAPVIPPVTPPVTPTPTDPEPKLGEGLIIKLLLDLLKQLSQQQVVQESMQVRSHTPPEPVDVNELMRLLSTTLKAQPPQ